MWDFEAFWRLLVNELKWFISHPSVLMSDWATLTKVFQRFHFHIECTNHKEPTVLYLIHKFLRPLNYQYDNFHEKPVAHNLLHANRIAYNFWPYKYLQLHKIAYTGTSKKIEYHKKVNIFCHSFQKVKPIYYIDSLHRVKYFKPLFLDILMIMAYR